MKRQKSNSELAAKLPHATDAEKNLLGALILGHKQSAEVFESLAPEDFFDPRHQLIFKTMREMWRESKEPDLTLLCTQLDLTNQSGDAGGIAYVSSVIDGAYRKSPIEKYANDMRRSKAIREIIHIGAQMESRAFEGEEGNEIIEWASERIAELRRELETDDLGTAHFDAAIGLMAALETKQTVKMQSGILELDEIIGGFLSGEVAIITAETGVGKTFFALQISQRSCGEGTHILYCSGEMLAQHLMSRLVFGDARIPYSRARHPEKIQDHERSALLHSASKQCSKCRILDGDLTLQRIRASARAMATRSELAGLIVDYDELVEVPGKDEWDQQRILMRSLKSLAMELAIPVVIVSQLRKALGDDDRKFPTLQRLYGSGAKAKHASIVLYVDRPYVQDLKKGTEADAKIFVLKNRDGRMGHIDCTFDLKSFKFETKGQMHTASLPYSDR